MLIVLLDESDHLLEASIVLLGGECSAGEDQFSYLLLFHCLFDVEVWLGDLRPGLHDDVLLEVLVV